MRADNKSGLAQSVQERTVEQRGRDWNMGRPIQKERVHSREFPTNNRTTIYACGKRLALKPWISLARRRKWPTRVSHKASDVSPST